MPTMIVLGYRGDLDQALQRRGLNPYYVIPTTAHPPKDRSVTCVTDMENAQEILRAVLAARIDDVAGVLSVHEMGIFGAAYLRQQLGLPGNADSQRILYFRDKFLQKDGLPPHIRRARCRYVRGDTSFTELAADLGEVFVVKPANGVGSLRTSIVRSPEEYAAALEPLPGQSDVGIVAESFTAGPEVYVDGIWTGGALRWWALSRYQTSPLSAEKGGVLAAHVMDERLHPALFHEARSLAEQVLSHLAAPDCVFHLEAFVQDSRLVFGECAVRLPGGLAPQLAELTFGVDLFDAEISLALGEEPAHPAGGTPERLYGFLLLRRSPRTRLTQQDFERNFTFDRIDYAHDAPLGPYGRVGEAIISDPDELKLRAMLEEIGRFNESGGG